MQTGEQRKEILYLLRLYAAIVSQDHSTNKLIHCYNTYSMLMSAYLSIYFLFRNAWTPQQHEACTAFEKRSCLITVLFIDMFLSYRRMSVFKIPGNISFPLPAVSDELLSRKGNLDWDVTCSIFTPSKHFKALTYHTCLWKEYLIRTVLLSLHLHPHPRPDPPTCHSNHLRRTKYI